MAPATDFSKHPGQKLFAKLAIVAYHFIKKVNFLDRIQNIHETGVTMVQAPKHVVSEEGVKQFSAITSTERSELALICSISAIGISIPTMVVFSRVSYIAHFIQDGPTSVQMLQLIRSGWINEEIFCFYR